MSSYYSLIVGLQLFLLALDVAFNAVCTLISNNSTTLLMIYMLQDTLIVIAIIILAITFSSTFVFQAGLISLLLKKFSSSIIFSIFYLFLSIAFHYMTLNKEWKSEPDEKWPQWMSSFYVLHRFAAILYYTSYKRAALLLSDPKYHGISEWLKAKIRQIVR